MELRRVLKDSGVSGGQLEGRQTIVLSCHQEPTIVAVADATEYTIEQRGSRRNSQSQGPMQAAGGGTQGLLRKYGLTTEQHSGVFFEPDGIRRCGW